MVAVFTGNGLGLFHTSMSQLGLGLGGRSALGQSRESQYVNVATGNLLLQGQDEQLFGQGLGAGLTRTYNSLGQVGGQLNADVWLTGFERRVDLTRGKLGNAGSEMTVWTGDGDTVTFYFAGRIDGQLQYQSTDGSGAHDVLRWDDRSSTWTHVEGSTRREQVFADHRSKSHLNGRLEVIRDGRTGAEFDVRYDRDGRVAEVRTASGDAMVFGYDREGRLVTLSTREDGVLLGQVSYAYDETGRLSRVTTDLTPEDGSDAAVFWTQYSYVDDSRMRIAKVEQSDGLVTSYTWYDDGRIHTATLGDTNTDDTDGAGQTQTFVYGVGSTDVTDSAGRTWTYEFDGQGQVTRVLSPAVNGQRLVSSYGYDTDGNLSWTRDADGRLTSMSYDAHGNLLRQVNDAGDVVTRTYSASNQVLTEATYPAGADSALVTRRVYDSADRLRYTVNALGEVTEHVYAPTATGEMQLSHSRAYVDARFDLTGLDAAEGLGERALDQWAAAQDPARTTRVDFTYDLRGQLSERRSWASVDARGQGVLDDAAEIIRYSHDAQGLLRQQIVMRGAQRDQGDLTSWTYDGMGRLLGSTDALGHATTRVYDDAGQRLVVTMANGLVQTHVRDRAGQTVAVTESATGVSQSRTSRFFHDAQGRLRGSEDASGARSYRFFDDAGRLVGEVDAIGAVTAYAHNGAGQVIGRTAYATSVDTTAWLADGAVVPQQLAEIVPAAHADDRTTRIRFDDAGRLSAEIDAAGTTTSYQYDGASRLLRIEVRGAEGSTDAPRITRHLYDDAGRRVATLDAEGYLTEWKYDPAGRPTESVRYAAATPLAQRADGSLADLRPAASAADIRTRNFYNGRGQAVATVDAEGYLSETVFDEAGHARAERRYANKLVVRADDRLDDLRSRAGVARETRTSFDARGQAVLQVNAESTITRFSYDAMGRLVATETAAGTSEVRENNARFDVFGNLIGELGGEGSIHLMDGMSEAELDAIYAQYGVRHSYDALGRRTESVDADGNRSWYFYDSAGRLTQTVRGVADASGARNAAGEVTETRYNAFGQASETIAYTGRIAIAAPFERAQVADAIRVLQFVAGQDSSTVTRFDRRGLVAARTDAEGYLTRYAYNAFGELSSDSRSIDANNDVVTTYARDRLGRLQRTTQDADGIARELSQRWDAFGRLINSTDGRGAVTSYDYDRLGRQVAQRQTVSGRVEQAQTRYDAWSRITAQTDALGHTTTYRFDDATRSVTVTTPEQVVMRTRHNRHGESVLVTDGLGHQTAYEYDHDGRLLRSIAPDGAVSTREYDARGLLTRTTDASGRAVEYRFDAAGRTLARITDPEGLALVTTYAYDGQGRQVSTTDPAGAVTRMEYDANGRLEASVRDAAGLALRTEYVWDGLGRQLSVTEGAGTTAARTTAYAYDDLGRRTSETVDPAGLALVTRYTFDGNDNVVRRVDGAGRVTRFVYDQANRLTLSLDGAGGVTRMHYDATGRLVATRRYADAIATIGLPEVVSAAQIESRLAADNAHDVQDYRVFDADGRLRFTIDGAGAVVRMDHDDGNRLTQTRRYATAIALDAGLRNQLAAGTLTADALAARVSADAAHDQVQSQVFDAAGRLRFSVDARGAVTESRFDASGRLIESRGYANPISVSPAFLAQLQSGQVGEAELAARVAGLGENGRAQSFVYDGAGRQTHSITRATVGTAHGVGVVTASNHDAAGRVLSEVSYGVALPSYAVFADAAAVEAALQSTGADNVARQRATHYRYDTAGRLRFTIDNSGAVTEQRFDAVGQVVQSRSYGTRLDTVPVSEAATAAAVSGLGVRVTAYAYDDAGRLTRTTDALGHGEQFVFDGAGLRTSYTNRDGHTWTYGYDAAGRQVAEHSPRVAVAGFDGSGNVVVQTRAITTRIAYDGLGNVIARTEDAGTASARTTRYDYDNRGRQIRTTFPDAGRWDAASNGIVRTGQTPTTEITYDALDRAIVQKDVRGFYEYRVYNAAGQLRYEVDQQGFVTAYTYNAFGEQASLTRFALAIDTPDDQPVSIEDVETKLQARPQSDRTLTTEYDLRGQKLQVQQSAVDYYDSAGAVHQQRPTTRFSFDAYGQLVRESVLLEGNPDSTAARWAHSTRYYDRVGRQTLTVDAEGYASAFAYSAHGELTSQTEYARALTGNINPAHRPGMPAAGDAATGFDRTTAFEYDALGRKVSENNRRHWQDSDGVAHQRDVSTRIGYDNEGHALTTTVDGVTTTTAYDALGRATSVLEAERDVLRDDASAQLVASDAAGLDDASLYQRSSPYSTMAYDAFGNVVQVHRFARGWRDGEAAPRASAADQRHTTRYDLQGRSVWERDAAGTIHVRRFDAADNLIESRYRLDGSDGRWAEVVTTARYDRLGRQTTSSVVREQYVGDTRLTRNGVAVSSPDAQSTVRYNAFGEIVAKDDSIAGAFTVGRPHATYTYDAAGRLVASNAEGGIERHYGYNLAGHQVHESHQTRVESTSGAVSTVEAVTRSRTDRLGRVVEQVMPAHTGNLGAERPTVSQRYDRWGNVLVMIDPRGGETSYRYNELDQAVLQVRPEVEVLHANGLAANERPTTEWFYDALGRLVGTRDANDYIQRSRYDASGRLVGSEDAYGNRTHLAYDALGQQSLTQDPLGYVTFRSFDRAGRIIAQGDYLTDITGTTRERHVRERYQLNQNGDRLSVTDALNNSAHYDYDSRGLVLRSRTAGGVVMDYGYDSQGRKVRETNALSDPSLLTGSQPSYRGGMVDAHVAIAGKAFAYTVPESAFTIPSGETPTLSAQITVWDATAREWVATQALSFNSDSRTLSGTPATGTYRVTFVASSASGATTEAGTSIRVVSQATFDAEYAGDPVVENGLPHQSATAGAHFAYRIPAGTFSDPQGQGLTYSAMVYGYRTEYDWETRTTRRWPAWIELERTATNDQWLTFDPATRTLSGTARGGLKSVRIVARDANGNTVAQSIKIDTGFGVDDRRTVSDDEGETLFLDEQSWDYDYFGRIQDHNDLSGADYDYAYDPATGQLLEQSSDWTEAARSYSTPLDDYLDRHRLPWWKDVPGDIYIEPEPRFDLGLPDRVLTNDPKRSLSYYANGQLREIREGSNWTRYAYDASGNRTLEETLTHDADGAVIHLRTQISYDAHNRITKVTQDELRASDNTERRLLELRYSYDAVGNRRRVLARNAYDVNAPVIGQDNQPPVVANAVPPQHVLLGETWAFRVPANTFRDPERGALQMDAVLADGGALPAWLTFDRTSQTFHGTPPGDTELTIKLTVTDLDGASVSTTFVLTASENRPPVVSGTIADQVIAEHEPWQLAAGAQFSDPDGRPLTFTGEYTSDRIRLPDWLHLDAQTGMLTGTPPAGAAGAGTLVHIIATDSAGASARLTFNLRVVANPNPENLGFELGDVGWGKGTGWSISSGDTYAGGWSAKFTTVGISSITHERLMPVEAGASYTASMMVSSRHDSAAEVILSWYGADGQSLGFVRGNLVKSGAWARSSVTGTPPAGAVYARVGGSAKNDGGEGPVVLDGFTFARVGGDGGGPIGGGGPIDDGGPIHQNSLPGDTLIQPQIYWPEDPEFPEIPGGPGGPGRPGDDYNIPEAYKTYWYTYDAQNRVSVAHGLLVDGTIVLGNFGVSYALDYDAAGHATRRRFMQGGEQQVETTAYDQRGQRIAVFQAHALGSPDPAAWQQTYRYDDVGHLVQRREYFDAGTTHANGIDIGGWLKHAEVYTYDADGRVLSQQIHGRNLDWTAPTPPPAPEPPPSSGPGAPELTNRGGGTRFFEGVFNSFTLPADTFIDHEGDPLGYAMTDGPGWLDYETLADGRHRFYGTPLDANFTDVISEPVTLTATDSHGNWTRLEFYVNVWYEGDGTTVPRAVGDSVPLLLPEDGGGIPGDDYPYPGDGGDTGGTPGSGGDGSTGGNTGNGDWDRRQITELGVLNQLATVDYGSFGFDAAGRLRGYQFRHQSHEYKSGAQADDPAGYTHTYTYQYEGRDSYLEKQVYGRSNQTNFRATSSVSEYDAWGRRTAVREQTPLPSDLGTLEDRIRYFSYDGEGHILRRRDGTLSDAGAFEQTAAEARKTQLYAYVGGQQVAAGKRNGQLDVIGNLTAYDSSEVGSTRITVQAGDTLRSIAQRVYGNANLWYVLAEANATTDAELTAGTTLTVPEVKVTANDASTFKPYNPSDIVGNTAPSLPYIQPPPEQHCNVIAMVLMIVVAVVVTYFTAGAATGWAVGALGQTAGTAVAWGIGGAVGSVASQAVGSAMGATSFSWRQVAVDGITSAVTAGFGQWAKGTKALSNGAGALNTAGRVAQGVVSYGGSVVSNAAVGRDTNFSWNAVAASAVGAFVSAKVGGRLPVTQGGTGTGDFFNDFTGNFVNGAANATAHRMFGLGKQDWGQIAADAFGNALGNSAVQGIGTLALRRQTSRMLEQMSPEERQKLLTMHLNDPEASGGRLEIKEGVSSDDEQRAMLQAQLNLLRAEGAPVDDLQRRLDEMFANDPTAPVADMGGKSTRIAKLSALFDQPLDPSISEADLAELEDMYGPAMLGTKDPQATTLSSVEVIGRREIYAVQTNAHADVGLFEFDQAFYDDIGDGLSAWSTAVAAVDDAANTWKGYSLKFNWAVPAGYAEHFVGTGGKPMPFVASPTLEGAQFVRQGNLPLNVGKIARVAGPVARVIGPASLVWEATQADWTDWGDVGHLGVGGGLMVAGALVSAPVALSIGVAWGVADYFVQDFTYEGQTGWRALGNSFVDYMKHDYSDHMEQVYRADPNYYNGPKY